MTRPHPPRRSVVAGAALLALPGLASAAPGAKPRVRVHTGKGDFVLELENKRAPLSSENFLRYVDAGKYDGGRFFRATRPVNAPEQGSLVGEASPRAHPYPPIAHESTTPTGLHHVAGSISLGRFAPGTATSDFFISLGATPAFDAHPGAKGDNLGFAVFGRVVQGMDVVRRIHGLPTGGKSPFADQQGQWLTIPVPILSMKRVG